jgi:hypothetical protein
VIFVDNKHALGTLRSVVSVFETEFKIFFFISNTLTILTATHAILDLFDVIPLPQNSAAQTSKNPP